MSLNEQRIRDNLRRIQQRIVEAAGRAGRDAESVRLVAVTKYVGLPEIRALVAAGCRDLGESRPQELWAKAEALADFPIRWHLIGHLQRNKIRRTLPYLTLVHSGDNARLIESLDRVAGELQRTIHTLLEVNISGDPAKHGFAVDQLAPLLPDLGRLEHVRIDGLMAMAGWGTAPDEARRQFAELARLRDRLRNEAPTGLGLEELSMGMSGDFEQAIAEGATLVRVGSALFEGLG